MWSTAVNTACAMEGPADPVVARGLSHTTQDEPLVRAAITRANAVLSAARPDLSRLSYQAALTPASSRAVPVYLIVASASAVSTPAAVPQGCVCVFVNPSLLGLWVKTHSSGAGRQTLDASYLLAFMLLHEVGHLAQGSSGGKFADGELSQLNIEPSLAKASEEDADEFVANLIRAEAKPSAPSDAFLAANWISLELTKLSWNMQAYRTLDEFGAFATGKPSVYFDQNYSHPNLAWRMLRSNDLIQQTTAARQLLEAFEEARQRGATPRKLYP